MCGYGVGVVVTASGAGGEGSGGGVAEHTPATNMRESGGGHASMQLTEGRHDRLHYGGHNFSGCLCRVRRWARANLRPLRRRARCGRGLSRTPRPPADLIDLGVAQGESATHVGQQVFLTVPCENASDGGGHAKLASLQNGAQGHA